MDAITTRIRNPTMLKRINDVQLYYMQVSRLSNIATDDGTQIAPWALQGIPNTKSQLDWIPRRPPLPENLKSWREALYMSIQAASGLHPSNLGDFIVPPSLPPSQSLKDVEAANAGIRELPTSWRVLLGQFKFDAQMLQEF